MLVAHEAGDRGGLLDDAPGLVGEVHAHDDVAGDAHAAHALLLRAAVLHDVLVGDLDTEDQVLHVLGGDALLEVVLHLALVTGVGVDHVPVTGQQAEFVPELLDGVLHGLLVALVRGVGVPAVLGVCIGPLGPVPVLGDDSLLRVGGGGDDGLGIVRGVEGIDLDGCCDGCLVQGGLVGAVESLEVIGSEFVGHGSPPEGAGGDRPSVTAARVEKTRLQSELRAG